MYLLTYTRQLTRSALPELGPGRRRRRVTCLGAGIFFYVFFVAGTNWRWWSPTLSKKAKMTGGGGAIGEGRRVGSRATDDEVR